MKLYRGLTKILHHVILKYLGHSFVGNAYRCMLCVPSLAFLIDTKEQLRKCLDIKFYEA